MINHDGLNVPDWHFTYLGEDEVADALANVNHPRREVTTMEERREAVRADLRDLFLRAPDEGDVTQILEVVGKHLTAHLQALQVRPLAGNDNYATRFNDGLQLAIKVAQELATEPRKEQT